MKGGPLGRQKKNTKGIDFWGRCDDQDGDLPTGRGETGAIL